MTTRATTAGVLKACGMVVGVLALAGLVTWLFGGFRPAPDTGPAAALGQQIELRRWVIAVDRVACLGPSGPDSVPTVQVALRITNTTKATLGYLPEGLVAVRAGSTEIEQGFGSFDQIRQRSAYDPDVEARLTFDYRDDTVTELPPAVTVVVRDERNLANLIFSDNWVVTSPAGLVRAPCPAVSGTR